MIGYLNGNVVVHFASGATVIDVNGVGYEVQSCSSHGVGEQVALFIYTAVREDAIVLFGFSSLEDRSFYELLLSVPGVGPSTALAAMRSLGRDAISLAIEASDTKKIATAPGIGAKTAQRIVLELSGKIAKLDDGAVALQPIDTAIESALVGLGYSANEIRTALAEVSLPKDEASALRIALGALGRS
jgi:Holliday junction DNA helicase RuvA